MPNPAELTVASAYRDEVSAAWFDFEFWLRRSQIDLKRFGRGGAFAVLTPIGRVVVKHYQRGGLMARLTRDRYLRRPNAGSRAEREFALLLDMRTSGLPVPEPIAARTERDGVTYRCDLITRELPSALTLRDLALAPTQDEAQWRAIGATIRRFHEAGCYHDDLNAQNILWSEDRPWLIDFDRGERRPPRADWQLANLDRLKRSLDKARNAQSPTLNRCVRALFTAARPD
jgi:3-deoxy-D-manno-octulosonic acid kinase